MGESNISTTISFERYDEEFNLLMYQIEKSVIDENPPSAYSQNLLQQADDLLKQMMIEARTIPTASIKRELLDKVKLLKSQLHNYQNEYDKKILLMSGSNNYSNNNNNDAQQQRFIQQQQQQNKKNEDMLANQNDILERAKRTMMETESVALEITDELSSNREKLMSAHNRVREVSGLAGRAKRILNAMNQRAVQQRIVLYSVMIGLVVGVLFLFWYIW